MIFPKYLDQWSTGHQVLYKSLFILLIIAVSGTVVTHFYAEEWAINWNIQTQSETKSVDILEVPTSFGTSLGLPADVYLTSQKFNPGPIQYDIKLQQWFAGVCWGLICLLLALVTYLSKNWCIGITSIFILLLMTLNLDGLLLFGEPNRLGFGIAAATFGGLAYYFNVFNPQVSLFIRFLSFAFLSALLAIAIYLWAEVQLPLLHLSVHTYGITLTLSVVLVLLVSQEIVHGILRLTGLSTNSEYLKHFLVFTVAYLGNLLLLYFEKQIGISAIPTLLVLLISVFTSLFIWDKRDNHTSHVVSMHPYGNLMVVVLALITTAFITFHKLTLNDPVLEGFEHLTLWSHMAFGTAFLIYILYNFSEPLRKNLKVYKVVFQENRLPYFSANLIGVVGLVALVMYYNRDPYFQAIAGYNNLMGDYQQALGRDHLAEQFYEESAVYGYRNHKAHYQLGIMAEKSRNEEKALTFYQDAIRRNPTVASYAKTADLQQQIGQFFEPVFTLNDGVGRFADHRLANDLGLLYAKSHLADSAYHYTKLSNDDISKANQLYVAAKNNLALDTDPSTSPDFVYQTNSLAYLLIKQDTSGTLSLNPSGYLPQINNFVLHKLFKKESEDLSKITDGNERTQFLNALIDYFQGHVSSAVASLIQLAHSSSEFPGYYHYTLGVIGMNEKAFTFASEHFEKALLEDYAAHSAFALASLEAATPIPEDYAGQMDQKWMKYKDYSLTDLYTLTDDKLKAEILWANYRHIEQSNLIQLTHTINTPILKSRVLDQVTRWRVEQGDISYFEEIPNNELVRDVDRAMNLMQEHPEKLSLKDSSTLSFAAKSNPFDITSILKYINILNQENKVEAAYAVLNQAYHLYPQSIILEQLYGLQCLAMKLDSHAFEVFQDLSLKLDQDKFEQFKRYYQQAKVNLGYYDAGW